MSIDERMEVTIAARKPGSLAEYVLYCLSDIDFQFKQSMNSV